MRARTGRQRSVLLLSFVAALALLISACGASGTSPTATPTTTASPTPEAIAHPTGADEYILRIAQEGGFVAPAALLTRLPLVTLAGNGCAIVEGLHTDIFPGPVLPNLLETCLTEYGVQGILQAAKLAGLMNGDADYGNPHVADATTTVFTLNAGGKTMTVKAYALGEATQSTGTPAADVARQKLVELQNKLANLHEWLPATAFSGAQHPYEVTRLQVVSQPVSGGGSVATPEGIAVQHPDWPLATPLSEIGQPFNTSATMRCTIVQGDDLATLMTQLHTANQLTQWNSGGEEYSLLLRPLLPGEQGCAT